jgi:hypothetical protein
MRLALFTILALLVSSTAMTVVLQNDGSHIEPGDHTDAIGIGIILKDGDWRMNLANNCLKDLFRSEGDGETAHLIRILNVTDFDLDRVSIREVLHDPHRIRFGFEFRKKLDLKTVYWEAECPVQLPEGGVTARAE